MRRTLVSSGVCLALAVVSTGCSRTHKPPRSAAAPAATPAKAAPQPAPAVAAQTAAAEQLSVREVERRVQQAGKAKPPAKSGAAPAHSNADIETLEREIADLLGAKVQLNHGRKGSGKLVIHYHGLDTLDGILEKLRR